MNEIGIDDLPQTVLEHIFFLLRPYGSLNSARQVNSRWRRIIDGSVRYMKRRYSSCKDFSWNEISEKLHNQRFTSYIPERGCHAACYSKSDNSMYMFGGSTSRYTPLSDMWNFNMESLEWHRVNQKGDIPSPRSLCTLLDAGEILILFGGYAKSSMNPINQLVQFFGDLYYFIKEEQKWIQIRSDDSGLPKLASHGASILQNRWMIITGGSSGEDFNGDVYIFDIKNQIWSPVKCLGEGPNPRHGHCQITIDDNNILIIGGAGVIKGAYSDVFLLTFDTNIENAKWKEITVNNTKFWPPHFWGIRGCKVENKVVFLSRPHFVNNDKTFHKRPILTAASSVASSSSGQSRLSSPDSPQDRRAVAAAFLNAQQKIDGLTESAALRRKSQFITSKSLDEQNNEKNIPKFQEFLKVSSPNRPSTPLHNKSLELQRACSIPAIIVGEIPKLIITGEICTPKQCQKNNQMDFEKGQNGYQNYSDETIQISKNHREINKSNETILDLHQRLCVFYLDITNLLSSHEASWHQNEVQPNAPPILLLYSLVEANGEMVVFGGMKDPTESNPFLHVNSPNESDYATNRTYLLKPNYFQL